jgi:hypothetical protein
LFKTEGAASARSYKEVRGSAMSSGDIAVMTSSGRAYYKLVAELKRRERGFLSLTPTDPIPVSVRAVITTECDKDQITHPCVFVYDAEDDAAQVVERVIQRVTGRAGYAKLVIGVDPGKRWGVAVLGDGAEVTTTVLSHVEDVVSTIRTAATRFDADETIVKIGNGAPVYQSAVIEHLDEALPRAVRMESVEEQGTTRSSVLHPAHKRRRKDADAAIHIARRPGRPISRRRRNA